MTSDWLHANDVNMGEHAKLVSWSQAIIGYIITDRQIDTFLQISTFFLLFLPPPFRLYFSSRKSFRGRDKRAKKECSEWSFQFWGSMRGRESLLLLVVPQPIDVDKSSRNARKSVWGWVIPFPRPITPPRNPRSRVLKSWKNLNFQGLYKGWWD